MVSCRVSLEWDGSFLYVKSDGVVASRVQNCSVVISDLQKPIYFCYEFYFFLNTSHRFGMLGFETIFISVLDKTKGIVLRGFRIKHELPSMVSETSWMQIIRPFKNCAAVPASKR